RHDSAVALHAFFAVIVCPGLHRRQTSSLASRVGPSAPASLGGQFGNPAQAVFQAILAILYRHRIDDTSNRRIISDLKSRGIEYQQQLGELRTPPQHPLAIRKDLLARCKPTG